MAQATLGWSLQWWYRGDGLVEIRSGDGSWKVRAERVSRWQADIRIHPLRPGDSLKAFAGYYNIKDVIL